MTDAPHAVRAHDVGAPHPFVTAALVAIAVVTVSLAAIFVKWADAPASTIAFWRNAIGALCLLPFAFPRRRELPKGRALALLPLAGVALALHFAWWIASLSHTSVAASVVLVCTQPIFVAVLARVVLGERVSLTTALGIAIALLGAVCIGAESLVVDDGAAAHPRALFGNLLALAGAVAIAVYVLLGRRSRTTDGVPLVPYTFVVYASAAATLLVVALAFGDAITGFDDQTWMAIVALALLPQLLGHTIFNWALKYVRAAVLSSTILLEPVIASALAWAIFDERPGTMVLVGGGVVLGGLVVVLLGRERG